MRKTIETKKDSVAKGLFWTFGERITAQLVTAIVTIILARILDPYHYGIISIVTIFITFCNVFVSGGLGSAIVQKKETTSDDYNSAFIISFCMGVILYFILFFAAPFIANFYDILELTPVIRVMGIRLIIASFNTIQQSYIRKNMQFKKFFFATLIGTIVSAVVGVVLAYNGFGVWALVAQYLTNTIIDTIVLSFVSGWKPHLVFKLSNAKILLSFGWKVLVTELIFTLEGDIRSLIVGKVFGSADLAYYDQGKKYPSLLVTNINSSINKVMLPAYSKEQDDIEKLKNMLRKSIRIGIYVLSPILVGFAMISNNFVRIVLTEKWIEAVPFIQIFCIIYLTRPLETSCHQALLAMGKSGLVMGIIMGINAFAILTILISVFVLKSVLWIAICNLLTTIISIILFMVASSKIIRYKPKEQLEDVMPSLFISIIMGAIVYLVGLLGVNILYRFIIQIITGMIIYLLLSIVTDNPSFLFFKNKVYSFKCKLKKKAITNEKV